MELFSKAIEGNESMLMRQIEVEGTGLWIQLQARNVLRDMQIHICQSQVQ